MDRYISVPQNSLANGNVPEEAKKLAKIFSLEIREEDCEDVSIVSKPKIKEISFMDTYSSGKVWSLNIHDEFVDMAGECILVVEDTVFCPKIKEKHIAKFRVRHFGNEEKLFTVYINGNAYFSGKISGK